VFRLVIEKGPDAGSSLQVREGALSLGKSPSNQLVLSDPFVSRFHGQILRKGDRYVYIDLQSSNGSALVKNGKIVPVGVEHNYQLPLEDGDRILLGDQADPTEISFEQVALAAPHMTAPPEEDPSGAIQKTTIVRGWKELESGLGTDRQALNALYRLTRSLTRMDDPGANLPQVLSEALFEAFPIATHVVLAEVAPDADLDGRGDSRIRLRMARHRKRRHQEVLDLPLSRSLMLRALREDTGILFSPATRDEQTTESLHRGQILSGMVVPIRGGASAPSHVLQVDNRASVQPFSERDLEVLTVFSVHVSRVLELFAQIESLARHQEALAHENLRLRIELRGTAETPAVIVGESPSMMQLFRQVKVAADLPTPVLIQGETGTGKELVALALHQHGRLRDKPFVVQNCAALADSLLDSELFGHRKGAFTGATRDKRGLFEMAHGGTLFLDELSEMAPATQAKLLRVLQDGTFRRIGEEQERTCRVRFIGATNRDLGAEVEAGRFRKDLFFRINALVLPLPPLRDRKQDIPALSRHLLARVARRLQWPCPQIPDTVLERLARHDFPGNVRELENILEIALIQSGGQPLQCAHLPAVLHEDRPRLPGVHRTPTDLEEYREARESLQTELERLLLDHLLRKHRGIVKEAAQDAGINRSQFHRMISRTGINPDDYRGEAP